MDLAGWREFARRYDPLGAISPEEIDALYARRDDAASDTIIEEIDLAERTAPTSLVLAGPRGTGKSTELLRVLSRLGGARSDFVPIFVDVAAAMPGDAVSTLAWLPLLGVAARRAAEDWAVPLAPATSSKLAEALDRFGVGSDIVSDLSTYVGAAAKWAGPTGTVVAGGAAALQHAAKGAAAIARLARTRLNEAVGPANEADARQVVAAVAAELETLLVKTERLPILLVDGIDKRPDVESVFTALQDAELLLELPAAIVLSGPIQLRHDSRFAALVMPGRFKPLVQHNLPVVEHDGSACERRVSVLREVHRHRAEASARAGVDLTRIMPDLLLDRAAVLSSGVVREFLELVRIAGLRARRAGREVIDAADLDAAARERRHAYELTLDAGEWEELARVYRTGLPPRGDVDRLVFQNLVACYQNDDVWYRPNELLVPFVRDRLAAT